MTKARENSDYTGLAADIAAAVPSGIISMWHGAASAIPSGWVICDGNNSTPNLTDKFIKSAAAAGATGGSATTGAHTLSIAEMPAHTHTYSDFNDYVAAAHGGGYRFHDVVNTKVTNSTGGNESRPRNTNRMIIIKY